MGSRIGVLKATANRLGIDPDLYLRNIAAGLKYCAACKGWKLPTDFAEDRTRGDGRVPYCRGCVNIRSRTNYEPVPPDQRKPMGPPRLPRRDGDKSQARTRVNIDVQHGKRPSPDTLPCVRCGHLGPDRRHNYHHHQGYGAQYHDDVVPVCTKCHSYLDNPKTRATSCLRGHKYTPENTIFKANGTRCCRLCRRIRDRARRDAAWWRSYRARRKA